MNKILIFTIIEIFFCFTLFLSCQTNDKQGASSFENNINTEIFQSVIDTLVAKGVDTAFISKYIASEKLEFAEKYIKINVTGYLTKADYSYVTDKNSIKKSKVFLKENLQILTKAESKYGVPKEIIVAILWVETKFGSYLGNNHLPSVFFSTALVSEEKYIEVNNEVVDEHTSDDSTRKELKKKILQRSQSKSKWAIKELVAMAEIEKKYNLDFNEIHGSWAGAYGIPQFLPSSYMRSAIDGNGDGAIDLFNLEDAIFSVGNYLSKYKWDNFENKKKAAYSYNNSNAYAEQIVKLSELIAN